MHLKAATSGRRRRRGSVACVALAALAFAGCSRGAKGLDDPANELPFGHVDVPAAGSEVKAESPVAGWALDDRGVTQIRVYVDNHIINSGALSEDRPDVSRIYPQYARGSHRHGFTLLAGFDAPGPHTILVQAVDSDGATRDIGVIAVTAVDK
jgi:hypothetical protein